MNPFFMNDLKSEMKTYQHLKQDIPADLPPKMAIANNYKLDHLISQVSMLQEVLQEKLSELCSEVSAGDAAEKYGIPLQCLYHCPMAEDPDEDPDGEFDEEFDESGDECEEDGESVISVLILTPDRKAGLADYDQYNSCFPGFWRCLDRMKKIPGSESLYFYAIEDDTCVMDDRLAISGPVFVVRLNPETKEVEDMSVEEWFLAMEYFGKSIRQTRTLEGLKFSYFSINTKED